MTDDWGPLEPLVGDWEGDVGIDVAYSHQLGEIVHTPYRERTTFVRFGPTRNGRQLLFGLDYRTTMWRGDDTVPFHAEVGYWSWDPDRGEVVRAFVVPRGICVLAAGAAAASSRELALAADLGAGRHSISEHGYLATNASSLRYRATIRVHDDDTWSYREATTLRMAELPRPFAHTDQNVLHRVAHERVVRRTTVERRRRSAAWIG